MLADMYVYLLYIYLSVHPPACLLVDTGLYASVSAFPHAWLHLSPARQSLWPRVKSG